MPVELDVCGEELPEAIAAAAYFVVAECLANAGRYGQACAATVQIGRGDGELRIEVSDDGVGGADPANGTGLHGLADRVEVLGGRLELDSPAGGGTRVTAVIPLERAAA